MAAPTGASGFGGVDDGGGRARRDLVCGCDRDGGEASDQKLVAVGGGGDNEQGRCHF